MKQVLQFLFIWAATSGPQFIAAGDLLGGTAWGLTGGRLFWGRMGSREGMGEWGWQSQEGQNMPRTEYGIHKIGNSKLEVSLTLAFLAKYQPP